MSKESLKLLVVMLRAAQTVEDLVKKDMRTYGINPTEFAVLELLYSKGDQPIQKIGEKILLASSSITYVVDKLEEKGFVERIDSSDDRRVKFASLTKKGKDFMAEVFPKHEKRIEEIFSILNDEERDLAIKLLKKIGLQEQPFISRIYLEFEIKFGEEGDYIRFKSSADIGNIIDIKTTSRGRGITSLGTVHHIAWRAEDEEDLLEWQRLARERKFAVSDVRDRKYFKSIYFREKGGILFEIATDGPGFAVDEDMDSLGENLMLPPQHEHLRSSLEETLRPIE